MAETTQLASLCSMCKQIFEGEWVEKTELALSAMSDELIASGPPVLICENDSDSDSNSDSQADISMAGVEWYESPDWVKKMVVTNTIPAASEDTTSTSFISPQHHSLIDLDCSAISGCQLCTLLTNIVAGRLQEIDEADIPRAVGVVIVRPHTGLSEAKESVVLAISYFLDGVVAQDAYLFGIEVTLLPHQVGAKESELAIAAENSGKYLKEASLRHIKEWLLTCSTNHSDCCLSTTAQSRLPTRLLLVQSGDGDPEAKICETSALPSQTRYLALSHCWGSAPIIRLLKNNYEEFKQGIDFNALSRTFQDAVKITLALNQQYIWIDSLCIIQDSAEDWQFEASLMCSVYSNALVTVAATASKDGSGGLFRSIDAGLARNCIIKATWTGHPAGTYICVDENLWDRQVVKAPLNTRGWVLQESILSPRIIHFAEDQIWWSCAQTNPSCNESFPDGVIAQDSMNLTTNLDPLADIRSAMPDLRACNNAWLDIVGTYTQRALSFGSDKLVALAGIAEACASIMEVPKDSYLAGFWRSELIVDLLWRMLGNGIRPLPYRAPSWTWASVDGVVLFGSANARDKIRSNIRSKVIEAR